VVACLAAAQVALGHDVVIFSHTSPGREIAMRRSFESLPYFDNVELALHQPDRGFERYSGLPSAKAMSRIIAKSRIVHVHGLWRPMLYIATRIATYKRIPYVIAPHGMLDPWSLQQSGLSKKLALWLGWRKVIDKAAFMHMLNSDEAALASTLDLQSPAIIIPNGIFPEQFSRLPEAGEFQRIYPKLRGRCYLIFLGRLHMKKGLDYLADAFSIVANADPDIDLVVAGPDEGAQGEFEERIKLLGLTGRVHLVGALYGREKLAALHGATCFCLPSRQEGFSMAIIEAMACGTPVVISGNCHFPEVTEVGAGDVVSLDVGNIARAILRMTNSRDMRQRASCAARDLALSQFTWPSIALLTIAAYEGIDT
jgi:glycosyltransferase involved in cell wall biosynthesis